MSARDAAPFGNLTTLMAASVLVAASACSPASNNKGQEASSGSGGVPGAGTGGTVGIPPSTGGAVPLFAADATAPADSCAKGAYQKTLLPSNMLFLVDRSGSMNCNLPPITDSAACEASPKAVDTTQPTKWAVISSSLSSAFDQLANVPNTSVALTFFSNDDICGVQYTPNVGLQLLAAPQVSALKAALANANPRGGTPLIGATIAGYHQIHQVDQAPGNRFVVLVTDGADSCIDKYAAQGVTGDVTDRLLNTEIPKARSVNIRTFVIGAPGSEPARGLLSQIAFAGGTPKDPNCDHSDNPAPGAECHLDMTRSSDFAADLSNALQQITGQAAMTCEFDVPQPQDGTPLDLSTVNVDYYKQGDTSNAANKVELYRDDTKPCDGGADGWQYIENNTKIQLCGASCDTVHGDSSAQVIVSVGCEQRIK